MKTSPSTITTQNLMTKAIALGICASAIVAQSASANITFDLRAAGAGADGTGKVATIASGAAIQLELWAQVTNAAPTNNIFGVQTVLGAIVSGGTSLGLTGSIAPMTFPNVFNATSVAGVNNEISVPADTLTDLGTSSTTAATNYPKARKDPTAAPGETVPGGTFFYATNNQPAGATVHPITNGFEFLMGTTTLTLSSVPAAYQSGATLNWKIPGFTTAVLRGQIAAWTDGDGLNNSGSAQQNEMFVGSPIALIAIPEPSAFGMVLLGAMGLVGFRRLGVRRS
jgi:hypothetical protein